MDKQNNQNIQFFKVTLLDFCLYLILLLLQFGSSPSAVDVDDGKWVGGAVRVEHHGRGVHVLPQVQLEAVAVFGDVVAVGAPVLVHVRVRLEVRVEHGLVDAGVRTLRTLEGFGA